MLNVSFSGAETLQFQASYDSIAGSKWMGAVRVCSGIDLGPSQVRYGRGIFDDPVGGCRESIRASEIRIVLHVCVCLVVAFSMWAVI